MRHDATFADSLHFPHDGPTLKNRLVKAAMVEGLSSIITGQPNEAHYRLYKRWADSRFGMIISGNVCVAHDHLGTPGDLRLPLEITDATLGPWRTLATSMTSNSSIGILQLVHTGRQSVRCAGRLPFNPPLAPSSIRISTNPNNYIGKIAERIVFQEPRTMNEQDIQHVIELFLKGAKLAYAAGFHGIELHASHGYLLSSFLSPKTNKRKDEYGGSTKARLQIIIEIIDCIRKEYKRPFVLGIKLNSTDYVEGGLTEEEALQHVEMLARHGGLDFIEISGGSYENLAFLGDDTPSPPTTSRTQHREAIFSAFASRAKEVVLKATNNSNGEHSKDVAPLIMCTGGFRSKAGIEQALRGDGIDLIGIGRPAAADPDWTVRLLASATKSSRSEKTDEDQSSVEDRCVTYKVNGGRWLQTLVPLKIVGGGMMTLWHELQMSRLGRGEEAKVEWTFERLLVVEFLQSAKVPLYVTVAIALLAIVSVSQFR